MLEISQPHCEASGNAIPGISVEICEPNPILNVCKALVNGLTTSNSNSSKEFKSSFVVFMFLHVLGLFAIKSFILINIIIDCFMPRGDNF